MNNIALSNNPVGKAFNSLHLPVTVGRQCTRNFTVVDEKLQPAEISHDGVGAAEGQHIAESTPDEGPCVTEAFTQQPTA